tara:strand:- start:12683 stop:12859 length:177 start_codon:yes stop_codon:yes gene_type:complete
VARRACRELAGARIERDCLELDLAVYVDGLQHMVCAVEEHKGVARDVGLREVYQSPGQ